MRCSPAREVRLQSTWKGVPGENTAGAVSAVIGPRNNHHVWTMPTPNTLHLRLPDGRPILFWVLVLVGACQSGTVWAGLCLTHHHHHSDAQEPGSARARESREGAIYTAHKADPPSCAPAN